MLGAMKASATQREPTRPIEVKHDTPKASSDEEEFNRAIRVLAPILHSDELEKYSSILGSTDVIERAREWKRRRRGLLAGDND